MALKIFLLLIGLIAAAGVLGTVLTRSHRPLKTVPVSASVPTPKANELEPVAPVSTPAPKQPVTLQTTPAAVPGISSAKESGLPNLAQRKIMTTNGVKHSVPLEEIIGGGPPQDGIPSIDRPKFISPAEAAKFLRPSEPGLALEFQGVNRFYPFQILVWHEIVNDTVHGQRVLITYCPLCLSGIVFDPLVAGERVEFGTSGKLWNSNLVMYDRKTKTLWSQILGEAIVGEQTGAKLTVLSSDQIRFGEWGKLHPDGEVLSKDTGSFRAYGQDPYGNYYTSPDTFFPLTHKDERLPAKTFILGIVIDGQAKAYLPEAITKAGRVEDTFAGQTIVAEYAKDIAAVRLFTKQPNGSLKRLNPFGAFWFSWTAAHPDTLIYQ